MAYFQAVVGGPSNEELHSGLSTRASLLLCDILRSRVRGPVSIVKLEVCEDILDQTAAGKRRIETGARSRW